MVDVEGLVWETHTAYQVSINRVSFDGCHSFDQVSFDQVWDTY